MPPGSFPNRSPSHAPRVGMLPLWGVHKQQPPGRQASEDFSRRRAGGSPARRPAARLSFAPSPSHAPRWDASLVGRAQAGSQASEGFSRRRVGGSPARRLAARLLSATPTCGACTSRRASGGQTSEDFTHWRAGSSLARRPTVRGGAFACNASLWAAWRLHERWLHPLKQAVPPADDSRDGRPGKSFPCNAMGGSAIGKACGGNKAVLTKACSLQPYSAKALEGQKKRDASNKSYMSQSTSPKAPPRTQNPTQRGHFNDEAFPLAAGWGFLRTK